MSNNLIYATAKTPTPGDNWAGMADVDRLMLVIQAMESCPQATKANIEVVSTKVDGQVIVGFRAPVGAAERGTALLDLEEYLKAEIDEGITVWLEPLGDKNSLRKLRGIEVKA
ncbi:MAG: hypothetical protein CO017_07445 [Zetaproteobacteria bacterium CG_4_8_14_3_um_filter_59_5]|nr:MAG: hypothetical protein COX56_05915 [Zetaproteobacteria bacterium CG23_combo_of_CG06-09_8_20_14_all_59_86]PIU97498.1 MAG: hypothetical protein COS62_03795 [Zetaproteobacteria bacterium CG03_land_8_20_14_0_80_59_51]PJC69601.1 MAG: hypothetical protein CO017_07445 [Zetaproteobacteria bacterium CG_4_8_14_3_um_filter_59_5]